MFGGTTRNKILRKMLHHSCPHKSYLPIFDSIKLERSSLLRMRRMNLTLCRKFHNVGILKTLKISNILYPGFTCEI